MKSLQFMCSVHVDSVALETDAILLCACMGDYRIQPKIHCFCLCIVNAAEVIFARYKNKHFACAATVRSQTTETLCDANFFYFFGRSQKKIRNSRDK